MSSNRSNSDQQTARVNARLAQSGDDAETVHGVALGPDDRTHGQYGPKRWPADELRKAAASLEGTAVRDGHAGEQIGEIARAAYQDGVGVVYEARLWDADIADQLSTGRRDVSIEAANPGNVDTDESGAAILRDFEFVGMAVVESGASDSNYAANGPASENQAIAALSSSDLSALLNDGEVDVKSLAADDPHAEYAGESATPGPDEVVVTADEYAVLMAAEAQLDQTRQTADRLESALDAKDAELEKAKAARAALADTAAEMLAGKSPHSADFYREMDDGDVLAEFLGTLTASPLEGDGVEAKLSAAELEAANERAKGALSTADVLELAETTLSPREFVQGKYGEDPADYDDDLELRAELREVV